MARSSVLLNMLRLFPVAQVSGELRVACRETSIDKKFDTAV
jgi:hypothetical protein